VAEAECSRRFAFALEMMKRFICFPSFARGLNAPNRAIASTLLPQPTARSVQESCMACTTRISRRSFQVGRYLNQDLKQNFETALGFKATPHSFQSEALMAVQDRLPQDIEFELQLSFFQISLKQHNKSDVIRLMQNLATFYGKPFILARVTNHLRQMDEETRKGQGNKKEANPATTQTQPSSGSPREEKIRLEEAIPHGRLTTSEIERVLRDLHQNTLSSADEKQLKDEAQALHEAGTAAVLAVEEALPKIFTRMVVDVFPWTDLLISEEVGKIVVTSPIAKAAARVRANEILERQEQLRKQGSWLTRFVFPSVSPEKIKAGQSPHIYDAALDAVLFNEFDKVLSSNIGLTLIEDTFRRVVTAVENTPDDMGPTIRGILSRTFVNHFIDKTKAAGIDYYSDMTKSFSRKLLSSMKHLRPYFAQRKRELEAASSV